MKQDNIIKEKSFKLAVRIVRLYQFLQTEHREYIISKQLMRSGTAVGALVREAEHAESDKDFIHKLSIGLKEANESLYWLELLKETGYLDAKMFDSIYADFVESVKLLTSIIKTSKSKL